MQFVEVYIAILCDTHREKDGGGAKYSLKKKCLLRILFSSFSIIHKNIEVKIVGPKF